ncbi:propanediol utilization protein PduB (plasmid) [Cereibacter sphaeroides WS8N]|uniref:propanediol utilization microcompartment protein PduB n=1 Tax=Cereibacter sphaeroides TaxID=1063 RepID=UPI00020B0298|nr:propanediol utilization microcompartment protein PduB [Cereibacter sphaeroides]AZB71217.1 propanediol utilization microcompartment protein PduB [Cereibacter sphaeroides]EGJ19304.1 propanediol utilization protein PduB [Cereibacter sphaeroides WS8N]MWP38489.1 propanediol utilization microcompartment protein PduB [Cereibacter sphaeroides]
MKDDLVEKLMDEVMRKMGAEAAPAAAAPAPAEKPSPRAAAPKACNLTEFVGTAIGHSVGLVIANVDPLLHEQMHIDRKYRSIGIVGARTGAGPHIFAADEAVKATNSEVVLIELPRDTEGGGGHGSLILFGAEDVSDARRAVEVTLAELERTFGDVYGTPAGHLEFQYTARASHALNKAFGAPLGQAFGITVGSPAAIGVLMADTAAKAATVVPVGYSSPARGTSFSNEVIFSFTGDSGAVRQSIIAAREVGKQLLSTLDGAEIVSSTKPYI